MARVLLSGGSGFLGGAFLRRSKNEIFCITGERKVSGAAILGEISGDSTSREISEFITKHRIDSVLHLATHFETEHNSEVIETLISNNVAFGAKLMESACVAGVARFVYTSSSWQSWKVEDQAPVNFYAATKKAFQAIVDYYASAFSITAVDLMVFDTYGPHDARSKLINALINAKKEKFILSPGHQKHYFVHVDDIIRAFDLALTLQGQRDVLRFSLPGNTTVSIRDLVREIESVFKKKLNIEWGGKAYRSREVMEPNDSLKRLPGWTAGLDLKQGLKKIAQIYDI